MGKTLVAYFSATGTTKRAAQALADAIGADTYEIRPATAYTRADLNWQDRNSRSTIEMNDPASRPEMADRAADIAQYDRVFLGFPIWWYTAPKIILSFLESYDFAGRTVIPFATSGGSGMGNVSKELAAACPGADVAEGKLLNGRLSADALRQWASIY
ncbi:MAG TPA: NAD(P)H-dependent oxidoreductase [Candidatus Scatomorpha intestinavium]|uniref:NAD(P)H-dependent oxidoreductase n=1 Tax=Candidatus Scatomorpha intestinavium TaxID=2840922 RepID=A0A9D1CTF5_9FIRM|nr:NAD(P)H-dependent oxidoreductase [Candidatus Scatomorpha intestinavium]